MMYQWIWGYPIFKTQHGCQQIWLIHNQSGKHWNTTLSIDIQTLGWPSCSLLNKKYVSLSLSLYVYIYIYTYVHGLKNQIPRHFENLRGTTVEKPWDEDV